MQLGRPVVVVKAPLQITATRDLEVSHRMAYRRASNPGLGFHIQCRFRVMFNVYLRLIDWGVGLTPVKDEKHHPSCRFGLREPRMPQSAVHLYRSRG
jgi:hypothetical protein